MAAIDFFDGLLARPGIEISAAVRLAVMLVVVEFERQRIDEERLRRIARLRRHRQGADGRRAVRRRRGSDFRRRSVGRRRVVAETNFF